ncbi:glycoprotein hormone beta-5-like [Elysia marginata]|uniref:Glycoprotein hormone beta-5-like n=1 Tax=Elysia marginata TaxID=1093978 RepID=A0AAV4GE64_9GAST|nr:glycoprotein hormone beta-5-like [Elysia marginata]
MRLSPRLYTLAPGSLLALLLTVLSLTVTSAEFINPRTTLMCHVRHYQFRVHKPDVIHPSTGAVLRCSGLVTVNSCWGRCDSSEVRITWPFKTD